MTIEDITDIDDEFALYSVYDGHEFYRVAVWESLDPEREGYSEIEYVTDRDGEKVTDEEFRNELCDQVMAFRGSK